MWALTTPTQAPVYVLLQAIPQLRSHFFVHGGEAGPDDLRSDILRFCGYPMNMQIYLEDEVTQPTIIPCVGPSSSCLLWEAREDSMLRTHKGRWCYSR